jgi:triphosphoribosyl-dephospho-CoA synthase
MITTRDRILAQAALSALIRELEAYPKPGLVSRIDTGAHTDMDYDLMSCSARALLEPFAKIAAAGRQASSFEKTLIPLGRAAEKEMLLASGGINTHRGAIFSLGMIIAAMALTETTSRAMTPSTLRSVLLETWGDPLQFHALAGAYELSHGAIVRKTSGVGGARAEAAKGFPSIFEIGLPSYREALASGLDSNACSVQTLFCLMAAVDDSNIVYRGGRVAANFVRQSSGDFLAAGGCLSDGWFNRAEKLHRFFIRQNLSPGGSADLLSGTLLVVSCCT